MIERRSFESYEAYVHAQGGKARGNRAELLKHHPNWVLSFTASLLEGRQLLRPGAVLCLGARTGAEVIAFQRLGLKAVGIDLHPVGEGVRQGDWHSMPEFEAGSFANCYSNSFDHCLYLDKACAEIRRVLEPGGRFYLMASDRGLKDEARAEEWRQSKKHNEALYWGHAGELRDEVLALGFRLVKGWKHKSWSHFMLEPKA